MGAGLTSSEPVDLYVHSDVAKARYSIWCHMAEGSWLCREMDGPEATISAYKPLLTYVNIFKFGDPQSPRQRDQPYS